jgi:hypothetical protein
MRLESMPSSLEVGAQILKVVDLTIEHSRHSSVFIADRLPASRHVYDREATHPKSHIPLDIDPLVVRAAVGDGSAHAIQHFRTFVTIRQSVAYETGYSTHREAPLSPIRL